MRKCSIVRLMGGLGNQMFQYAFGKALERKFGQKVLFDLTWFEESKKEIVKDGKTADGIVIRPYKLDVFPNIKIDVSTNEEKKACINEKKFKTPWLMRKIFKLKKYHNNVVEEKKILAFDKALMKCGQKFYNGYFQNEKYFKEVAEDIKRDFAFADIDNADVFNQKVISKINNTENPVFIHVRRGDYLSSPQTVLTPDYYKRAVQEIIKRVSNPTFFVFGQECEDFIKSELNLECAYEYVGEYNSEQGKDYVDMQLMSMCKHGIIANSTFSWWAAWLMPNKDKVIIAPSPWVNNKDEIVCENWIKVRSR